MARKHKTAVMAQMNMVPLIDVALILLIIFMVMSPFLVQAQIEVALPKSSQGKGVSDEQNIINVEIFKGGKITVDGKKTSKEDLEEELTLKLAKSSKKTVLVQADKSVPIQQVVFVFDIAKKLNAGKLGIAVANEN